MIRLPARTLLKILACLCLVSPAVGGSTQPWVATDFNRPEFFPILPWDPFEGWDGKAKDSSVNGFEAIAACQFNMAGFVRPKDLARCRKLGLGAILLPSGDGIETLKYQAQWKELNDKEIERRVRAMIKAGGSNPALRGYFIMDEPGVNDFPALGKAVAAVKKYAPGKLAYINLFPDYATLGAPDSSQLGTTNYTDYVERFVAEVNPQVLSYDNYMVQYSDDLKDPTNTADYFRNLLEVRRVAQKHQLPCLNIVAACQLRPDKSIPTPANLLLQAYTTLAAGYRGVTWYTFYGRGYLHASIDNDGHRTTTWTYLAEVNRQIATLAPVLSRLRSTGVFFSSAPTDGLAVLPGRLVGAIKSSAPIMVGEFTDDYFMLVNISPDRSANFTLELAGSANLQEVSAVDGGLRASRPGKNGYWLGPGQGVLLHAAKPQPKPASTR